MAKQITKEIYNFLVLHILEMRNQKINIANQYSIDYEKYIEVLEFLNSYIISIEEFLDKAKIVTGDHIPPFVIIGSIVDVADTISKTSRSLMIMAPGSHTVYDETKDGCEMVSCFSDIGRSMLLQEEGHSLTIKKPGGSIYRKIQRITYDLKL
ncbi:MAG: hypothetical protein ACOX8Q_04675 [Christensenellales bacterium]|jgi:transcription elongation GreA/GreB family factor